ncbi:Rnf-Nqr domain containing protein [Collinsella tanakaei]|uniref:Rnf-Nqr domain containing protein n=1 Tax=Collinsella tanakaei TaxID=626935 RepID=UPI0025A4C0A0|nr:Rnf-Nqr domain containing protein [Collinsella tanakaei]MDM8245900.1 Rnf-Nqr domain containing protein [Collinsella tanakaei]
MALNELIQREQDERVRALTHTPTFLVVAGSLPGLFVATSVVNGFAIGAVSAVSILAMAILARPLRAITGRFTYIPVTLMISATIAILLGFAVRVIDPLVHESLGIYIPLVAVNAMAMMFIASDGFAAAPAQKSSLGTALFAAVCACAALTFVGFFNGMLTTGEVFGLTMNELAATPIAIFGKPAGSLLLLAVVAVFVQSVEHAVAVSRTSKGGER